MSYAGPGPRSRLNGWVALRQCPSHRDHTKPARRFYYANVKPRFWPRWLPFNGPTIELRMRRQQPPMLCMSEMHDRVASSILIGFGFSSLLFFCGISYVNVPIISFCCDCNVAYVIRSYRIFLEIRQNVKKKTLLCHSLWCYSQIFFMHTIFCPVFTDFTHFSIDDVLYYTNKCETGINNMHLLVYCE